MNHLREYQEAQFLIGNFVDPSARDYLADAWVSFCKRYRPAHVELFEDRELGDWVFILNERTGTLACGGALYDHLTTNYREHVRETVEAN